MILLSNKQSHLSFTYHLNNSALEWADTFKYLRVVINQKCKWHDQTNHSKFKVTKLLNLLRRNQWNSSLQAKKRAYLALVCPHLEFSAPVWMPQQQKYNEALEKVKREQINGCAPGGISPLIHGTNLTTSVVRNWIYHLSKLKEAFWCAAKFTRL